MPGDTPGLLDPLAFSGARIVAFPCESNAKGVVVFVELVPVNVIVTPLPMLISENVKTAIGTVDPKGVWDTPVNVTAPVICSVSVLIVKEPDGTFKTPSDVNAFGSSGAAKHDAPAKQASTKDTADRKRFMVRGCRGK